MLSTAGGVQGFLIEIHCGQVVEVGMLADYCLNLLYHVHAFLLIFTAVGGIMAFLVLHEMLPLALEYTTKKEAVPAVLVGMAVMSANLYLLSISLPPDVGL